MGFVQWNSGGRECATQNSLLKSSNFSLFTLCAIHGAVVDVTCLAYLIVHDAINFNSPFFCQYYQKCTPMYGKRNWTVGLEMTLKLTFKVSKFLDFRT